MQALKEMATHYQRLARLLVAAVDTLHRIADGTVDNPQRLAKKSLKHLISEFKTINEKTINKLTDMGAPK